MMRVLSTTVIAAIVSILSIVVYDQFFLPASLVSSSAQPRATLAHYDNGPDALALDRKLDEILNREAANKANAFAQMPENFTDASTAATPAVVYINSSTPGRWRSGSSSGSGVITSPDGYIVTNNHVIEGGTQITITTNDKQKFEAQVVGRDPNTDLAVLKVETSTPLPYLSFANSDNVRVGEWVLAVGNPFNLTSTVTAGIVSAKARNINILESAYSIESFIQTDAAVNPGNSGGALVDTKGNLVGINTAILTETGSYEGYSFAIPANLVKKVMADLKDFGTVQRGFLGVNISEVDADLAAREKLPNAYGVYLDRVKEGSGAAQAGLRRGDVIVQIGNSRIKSLPQLQEQVAAYRPGDEIQVAFYRNGQLNTTQLTLRNSDNTTEIITLTDLNTLDALGVELRDLDKQETRLLGKQGVVVRSIKRGSIIAQTNMDPGFIITHVNTKRVKTTREVAEAIENASGKIRVEGFYDRYPGEYVYAFTK